MYDNEIRSKIYALKFSWIQSVQFAFIVHDFLSIAFWMHESDRFIWPFNLRNKSYEYGMDMNLRLQGRLDNID